MQEFVIDSQEKLLAFCRHLDAYDVLALDTEFLREKTYYAQLCLIQIACDGELACVDPLALEDIQPLLDIIYDPARIKIMHSARQDLELFFDLTGRLPQNIFDTQVAATLLGFGDQIGYAKLVKQMLDVKLDKTQTRTDWSRRPLTHEQIEYALDDVRYLHEIFARQRAELAERGRSDWLDRDFATLSDVQTYATPDEQLWQRVRGSNTLHGVQLAVLQQLTQWREQTARHKNRPRRWVLRDDLLIDLARRTPSSSQQLEAMRGVDGGVLRHADKILALIKQAKALPPEQWPRLPKFHQLTLPQEALVDAMMAIVKMRAEQNSITPAVLASRKDLEKMLLGKDDLALLTGWRFELAGKDLQAFLRGDCLIRTIDGHLNLTPVSGQ
jgi:ribonuclease D